MKIKNKVSAAILFSLSLVLLRNVGRAEEKKAELTNAQYLEQLQAKLDHEAQRMNKATADGSNVAGLRGSKQESASKNLYWKGKKRSGAVSPDELKAFRSAIEQARAGKTTEATAALKTFQTTYPKSVLLPDVTETLTRLSTPPAP